jgi:predicted DNA-binding transcriptional regulator YafY
VGQRGRTESVTAVLAALFTRKTWRQSELAREVGLSTEALRKLLKELQATVVHLEQQAEHPHVYWSAPRTWFPGGVLFEQRLVPELLQQLRRLPRSKARERLLGIIAEQAPARACQEASADLVTRSASEQEEQYVPIIENAAARKVPVRMKYLSGGRGPVVERHASVHLVDVGPPVRFIATCHRSGALRTFRIDNIVHARVDDQERFRDCETPKIAAYRAASLDGYKGSGDPIACSFVVRDPEAGWVANNVLEGMRVETVHGGIRVLVETSAMERLARFVVGLGAAARPETRELAEAVEGLALGALEGARSITAPTERSATHAPSERRPARVRSDV